MKSLLGIVAIFIALYGGCKTFEENTSVPESLWGEGGAIAYPNAAAKMARDFPKSFYMGDREKILLRPIFGELVDQVAIHWDTVLLDEWANNAYGISLSGSHATAQTYGYRIYFKGPRTNWDDRSYLEVLIHELVHAQQFISYGATLAQFGYEYFRAYYLAGQVYENNPLEQEAIQTAHKHIDAVYKQWKN